MTRTPQVVITPGLADITAPTVTTTSPADGATYTPGQVVNASYSCADPDDAVTSCLGPVASGNPVDTSTVGAHVFTVNASDHAANTTSKTVHYTITAPRPPTASLGGISVAASGATARSPAQARQGRPAEAP